MKVRNFLIVYNWRTSEIDHVRDLDWELDHSDLAPDSLDQLYRHYEERYPQKDGYEVVWIGADSLDTIRKTHSHYFQKTDRRSGLTETFEELQGEG